MKAINDVLAIVKEGERITANSLSREVEVLQDILKRIDDILLAAQDEWIVCFWLEGVYMSAKVMATNGTDACDTVGEMFPERVVNIVSTNMTHGETSND